MMERRYVGHPPQHGRDGADRTSHRQPGGGMLWLQAEETPESRQFEDPEEVGVAFDVFAGVEDEAMSFEEVADIAKADEGIIG